MFRSDVNLKKRLTVSFSVVLLWLTLGSQFAYSQKANYKSEFANVNGVKIHYLTTGSGKKALVLIHGFAETSRMWLPFINNAPANLTLIAPDIRGLGDSSRPASGYDKKTAAVDIHELVKSKGFDHIYLVGHDIGLMVAYAYAAQFPSEVDKLVLMEAPIPGVGAAWNQIFTNPILWHFHFVESPIALDLVKGREKLFLEHFWGSLSANPKAMPEEEKNNYARAYAQEGSMKAAFEYFKAFNRQDAEDNRKFAQTKLTMPVLVIAGDKSMGDALDLQARDVATNVTALKFENTGHWLMEERRSETIDALKKFLATP